MTVNILAFGVAREIFGKGAFTIQLDGDATVRNLKNSLAEQYPALKQLSSFTIAVNNEYAAPTDIIAAGDEVAVIPPVSGG